MFDLMTLMTNFSTKSFLFLTWIFSGLRVKQRFSLIPLTQIYSYLPILPLNWFHVLKAKIVKKSFFNTSTDFQRAFYL